MWDIDRLIRWLFSEQVRKRKTLADFLAPWSYEDRRSIFQSPPYINPSFDGLPTRDDITTLVLHCTADDDKPRADVFHLALYDIGPYCHINPGVGCPSITYHYYIEYVDGTCTINRCLDDKVKAWHVGPHWNATSLGVAIDYDGESELPKAKWEAAAKLMAWLCRELGLPVSRVVFHRELEHTGWRRGPHGEKVLRKTCPGHLLDPVEFREAVATHLASLGI